MSGGGHHLASSSLYDIEQSRAAFQAKAEKLQAMLRLRSNTTDRSRTVSSNFEEDRASRGPMTARNLYAIPDSLSSERVSLSPEAVGSPTHRRSYSLPINNNSNCAQQPVQQQHNTLLASTSPPMYQQPGPGGSRSPSVSLSAGNQLHGASSSLLDVPPWLSGGTEAGPLPPHAHSPVLSTRSTLPIHRSAPTRLTADYYNDQDGQNSPPWPSESRLQPSNSTRRSASVPAVEQPYQQQRLTEAPSREDLATPSSFPNRDGDDDDDDVSTYARPVAGASNGGAAQPALIRQHTTKPKTQAKQRGGAPEVGSTKGSSRNRLTASSAAVVVIAAGGKTYPGNNGRKATHDCDLSAHIRHLSVAKAHDAPMNDGEGNAAAAAAHEDDPAVRRRAILLQRRVLEDLVAHDTARRKQQWENNLRQAIGSSEHDGQSLRKKELRDLRKALLIATSSTEAALPAKRFHQQAAAPMVMQSRSTSAYDEVLQQRGGASPSRSNSAAAAVPLRPAKVSLKPSQQQRLRSASAGPFPAISRKRTSGAPHATPPATRELPALSAAKVAAMYADARRRSHSPASLSLQRQYSAEPAEGHLGLLHREAHDQVHDQHRFSSSGQRSRSADIVLSRGHKHVPQDDGAWVSPGTSPRRSTFDVKAMMMREEEAHHYQRSRRERVVHVVSPSQSALAHPPPPAAALLQHHVQDSTGKHVAKAAGVFRLKSPTVHHRDPTFSCSVLQQPPADDEAQADRQTNKGCAASPASPSDATIARPLSNVMDEGYTTMGRVAYSIPPPYEPVVVCHDPPSNGEPLLPPRPHAGTGQPQRQLSFTDDDEQSLTLVPARSVGMNITNRQQVAANATAAKAEKQDVHLRAAVADFRRDAVMKKFTMRELYPSAERSESDSALYSAAFAQPPPQHHRSSSWGTQACDGIQYDKSRTSPPRRASALKSPSLARSPAERAMDLAIDKALSSDDAAAMMLRIVQLKRMMNEPLPMVV